MRGEVAMREAILAALQMVGEELADRRVLRCRFCKKDGQLVVEVEGGGSWTETVYDDAGNEVRQCGVIGALPPALRRGYV